MKTILLAIDGSDSYEWRPLHGNYSHVNDFYRRFPSGMDFRKTFRDGPAAYKGVYNSDEIKNWGMNFILTQIRKIFGNDQLRLTQKELKVVLVGHSRGGAIVACIAEELYKTKGIKTYFIGLYDAVNMTINLSPANNLDHYSTHVFHAYRNPVVGSRDSFGNCCMGVRHRKKFFTSHGGMGGAPIKRGSDSSLNPESMAGGIMSMQGLNIYERGLSESKEVGLWMLRNAKSVGIKLN